MRFMNPTVFALSKDVEVQFFPSYAHWEESRGGWQARLRGWVFEPEKNSLARKALMEWVMEFIPPDGDQGLFHKRLQAFLVDSKEEKSLRVRWGKGPIKKIRSGEEGELTWNDFTPSGRNVREGTNLPVRLISHGRTFEGRVLLIGPKGLTVVTDIDDTIKISSVTMKKELLANTFFRPWRAVPGMATVYQQWAKEGAVFHYVSNSPWPLKTELESFLAHQGFPSGTIHLRPFSARAIVAKSLFNFDAHHKGDVLRSLMNDFPQRKFIFIGDSGEQDPEIYGAIAAEFQNQVVQIFIRRVTPDSPGRYQTAFGSFNNRWNLFNVPSDLPPKVLP